MNRIRFLHDWRAVIVILSGAIVGVTFLVSGAIKLYDPGPLAEPLGLLGFHVIAVRMVQLALPPFEIALGFILIFSMKAIPRLIAVILLGIFTTVLWRLYQLDQTVSCGCFAGAAEAIFGTGIKGAFLRNGILIALCLLGLVMMRSSHVTPVPAASSSGA